MYIFGKQQQKLIKYLKMYVGVKNFLKKNLEINKHRFLSQLTILIFRPM